MHNIKERLENVHWETVLSDLDQKGFAIVPELLPSIECKKLVEMYDLPEAYRKMVIMEHYRFGSGEYKYFSYPLPGLIQTIRENIYPEIVPVANRWMKILNQEKKFPGSFEELQDLCRRSNQTEPTVLILKYGKGGYNTLHQDLYGEVYFPIQLVLFLNEPEEDYTGGEFVLTQQTPRAQSKAIVLKPKRGDMLLFTTNFRPVKGRKGYYRAMIKHGVSEVHDGQRHTLGIIFHDAIS